MIDVEPLRSVTPHGKFFSRKGQKFFLKAMRLEGVGATLNFDAKVRLLGRLDALKQVHTTALVLAEAQSNPILDLASTAGLYSIVELGVAPEDLIDRRKRSEIITRIAHTVNILNGRPGLLGFLINCPISQDALRAYGLEKARRALRDIIGVIKRRNESALVAIRHRPETRALTMLEEDFIYGEVPALAPVELRDYIVSLHNLAEARPLVIEFSQSSPGQDEAVAVAFGTGAAGVVAPPVPTPASPDWMGAVTLKASELMPFVTLNGTCPPGLPKSPMVSVVICAYNAERTMLPCLESLRKLDYPNFEVIIVDDGSRDRTAEISLGFPEFRLIRQSNKGLSVARNVGLHAARGDIIAYTDSDCVVDPHWLSLMVRTLSEKNFDGCGGPNYAPHEDGWVEACCAASPGAPCHVLTADDVAEHLAGCNMVFTKAALLKVGGFDPQFTSAGDDVDVCWRILDSGMRLGFCPSAFVWHFRRNTIQAYYGQQRGYGRAEAMLYSRYPARFNILGQIKWRGMIPGLLRTVPGGSRKNIFWAAARPGVATVLDPTLSLMKFLPQTLEWTLAAVMLALVSLALHITIIPAVAMLAMGPIWALYYAWHAPIEKSHISFSARMLVAYLAYTGPVIRTTTRYKTLAKAQKNLGAETAVRQRPTIQWLKRTVKLAYWNEAWTPRDVLLDRLSKFFAKSGHPSMIESGWKDYDLEVRPSPFTTVEIKTADEEHEQGKLKNHVAAHIRMSRLSALALATGATSAIATAALSIPILAVGLSGLTLVFGACVMAAMAESGRLAYRAVEECAAELNLFPLGTLIKPRRAALGAATANAATKAVGAMDLASAPNPPATE
jgi:glycosyltransferase involved in cell wall biosynthesis